MRIFKDGNEVKVDIRNYFQNRETGEHFPTKKGVRMSMGSLKRIQKLMPIIKKQVQILKDKPPTKKADYKAIY